jgi:hypothetical protein
MAGSEQRAHGQESDGMRIDNHANWTGKAAKGSIFAPGAKMKSIADQEGSGSVMRYEDTEERIKDVQEKSVSQVKKHPMKPGYRY